jgi:hypothetical protein
MARFETRDEAIEAAAVTFAHICEQLSQKTPEEIAEAAYEPGGPSKEELAAVKGMNQNAAESIKAHLE